MCTAHLTVHPVEEISEVTELGGGGGGGGRVM